MNTTTCLDAAALAALLEGEAEGPVADHAEHLETCMSCQRTLAELADVLPRAGRVRFLAQTLSGANLSGANEPALDRVIGRLKETDPFLVGVSEERPGEDLALSFLAPEGEPGMLGRIGRFEILEVIGRGGMGVVLKALDPDLNRVVAIKILSPHLASSAEARQRFKREARAAAAVCHDHVVTIHGVHEADGAPYLVMQFIAGESLQTLLDRTGPLAVEEVVRIGLQTASGLAAAHARGLIHRDVKPANILLEGDTGRVKITDFGLARTTDDVSITRNGIVAGTPPFMAPEQARGEPADPRADLFSLGSTLYACCTGMAPFHGETLLAILHAVNERAPVPLHAQNPNVPGWLERLIARLMAKEPDQRCQSAAEVAALLEGYLVHLRQPALDSAPALPAVSEPAPKGQPVDFAGKAPLLAPSRRSLKPSWLLLLLVLGLLAGAAGLSLLGLAYLGQGFAEDGKPKDAPAQPYEVWSVAVSPDGKVLAAGAGHWTSSGEVGVWDLATRKPLQHFAEDRGVGSVAFSPDGKLLAFGSWSSRARVLDWAGGKELAELTASGLVHVAFSPDGSLLATACEGQTLQLWGMPQGELLADLQGDLLRFHRVTFSPDGKRVLAAGGDWKQGGTNHVGVWDVASKKQILKLTGHDNTVMGLACSPDGKTIATGSMDQTIRLWDAETGRLRKTLKLARGVENVAFTADGKTLLSCGPEPTIRIWDLELGKETTQLHTRIPNVRALYLAADGKTLVVGGAHKCLKIFDLETRQPIAVLWNGVDPQNRDMDELPVTTPEIASGSQSTGPIRVIALVFGITLALGLITWFLVRRGRSAGRRRDQAPVAEASVEPEPIVERISFACSACGAKLKVKGSLAGKKVKCSQCGRAVSVPSIQAGERTS